MVMDENFHVGISKDVFAEEQFFRRRSFKKKRVWKSPGSHQSGRQYLTEFLERLSSLMLSPVGLLTAD
jgi:hypothetical protein